MAAASAKPSTRATEEGRRRELWERYNAFAQAFAEVPEADPQAVYAALSSQAPGGPTLEGRRLVLVDTRSQEECAVSMIPWGTLRTGDFEAQEDSLRDCAVVCYCTVGLRSGKFAARLRREKGMQAYNLKGSLLGWTHEHLPLTSAYDPAWGSAAIPAGLLQGLQGAADVAALDATSATGGSGQEEEPRENGGAAGSSGGGQRAPVAVGAGVEASDAQGNPGADPRSLEEGLLTRRVHVFNDTFALQADGYVPVAFPSGWASSLASLVPSWIIARII